MNHEREDTIEALLRQQFDGPVPDKGFSERLMQRLPQSSRRVAWPVWGGMLMGAVACWLALLRSPLLRIGWWDCMDNHWSGPAITVLLVMLGMAALALAWGVAEADDR
ncbi:MAG: hypothetical protein ACREPZ_07880 [Rhodanobacteraceae bacterium]